MIPVATDSALADLLPRVERIARKYWRHSEHDDLVQEGWIACWQSLAAGVHPSNLVIEGRMKNWIRYVKRHDGQSYELTMEGSE